MNITVKNLKTWNTRDGGGYQATVYIDGKKAFQVTDDGHGGCLDMTVADNALWNQFKAHVAALPVETFIDGTDHETIKEWMRSEDFKTTDHTDIYIGRLVGQAEENKQLKRLCKKDANTVIRLREYKKGEVLVIKAPFTNEEVERLRKEYGHELVEIINLRFQGESK